MEEKFVPYEKLSKKEKKKRNKRKRRVWGFNPITRRPINPRAYNRAKEKQERIKEENDGSN